MPSLLHSVPNHPWIGKLLFDHSQAPSFQFRGIIQEVSDDQQSDNVYVRIIFNDEDVEYTYVSRTASTTDVSVYKS